MMTMDLLPGFGVESPAGKPAATARPVVGIPITPRPAAGVPRYRHSDGAVAFHAFALRAASFGRSMPPARRAAVVARPRFHSMPWLCRADDRQPDHDIP